MGSKNKVRKSKRKKTQEDYEENLFESDETFAFIAGYTSGGVPYGITWEEMEEIKKTNYLEKNEDVVTMKKTIYCLIKVMMRNGI